jgi:hypothetical protein
MHDCCTPGGGCSKNMEQMPEELMARFEELAAFEHEFEDVEDEISKSHLLTMRAFAMGTLRHIFSSSLRANTALLRHIHVCSLTYEHDR